MTSSIDAVRFGFGANWRDYARIVEERDAEEAIAALSRLLPDDIEPRQSTFLDIGSGSGLHSVAASRLGFKRVVATDYDPVSVATTISTAKALGADVEAFRDDILATNIQDTFDVVYSWGVLHHTGDMWRAIDQAMSLVKPGGNLVIAIYLKTPRCEMWKRIKRAYSSGSKAKQFLMFWLYYSVLTVMGVANGTLAANRGRGMRRRYDAVDWLGGYPYESASKTEVTEHVIAGRFAVVAQSAMEPGDGWLGSGCREYVFRRLA
jgi:2-polyprenyl-6-hydroxyphenyl methylase/3-demethylubiquinone-9 3-methyltransferase